LFINNDIEKVKLRKKIEHSEIVQKQLLEEITKPISFE
jgi:hypothetical protein